MEQMINDFLMISNLLKLLIATVLGVPIIWYISNLREIQNRKMIEKAERYRTKNIIE